MLTPTPNPTIEEIRAEAPLVNGNVPVSVSEIVVRLQQLLPDYIISENAANGWVKPVDTIVVPDKDDILVAPTDATQVTRNAVFVAFKTTTTPQGVGAFKNIVAIKIWSIEGRASTPQQIQAHARRIECVRAVLLPFLRGCVTADGQKAWRLLEPNGYEIVGDRRTYSGAVAYYTLVQSP